VSSASGPPALPVLPVQPSPDNQAHFDGLAEGRLLLPRCDSCEQVFWYPRRHCPLCGSSSVDWVEASGRGTIYSFTVLRRAEGPYAAAVPYVLAYVELAEGIRLMTNIVGVADPTSLEVGQAVEAVFESGAEFPMLRFRPA
jgi:uncharacterized OB-fold protein